MEYFEIKHPNNDKPIQFHDLLVDAFPDPYSREDINNLRHNLMEGSWENGDEICRYHIIVAQIDNQIVGGTSFYFYKNRDIALGMGAYLAVKKEFWGNGIGTKLIKIRDETISRDAGEFNCSPLGLIIQASDPELMSEEEIRRDPMDPWKREKFWKKRGYRKIAFNFIQPSIRLGEPPVEYLSLYMFPYCEEWKRKKAISKADLWNVVNCFIKCTETLGPPETDTAYIRMKNEIVANVDFQLS